MKTIDKPRKIGNSKLIVKKYYNYKFFLFDK